MSFSLCRVLTLTYSRNDLKLFCLVVRTDLLLLLYGAPGWFVEQRLTYLSYLYLNLYLWVLRGAKLFWTNFWVEQFRELITLPTSVMVLVTTRCGTSSKKMKLWPCQSLGGLRWQSKMTDRTCASRRLGPVAVSARLAPSRVIPWSRTRLGDRSFDVAGPRLWNKLPASLRSSDSLCQFRRQLKTFLFVKD